MPTTQQSEDPLMTVEDLAAYFSKSKQSIYLMRHRGQLPPAIRLGGSIRFRKSAVDAWLAEQAEEVA